VIQVAGAPAGFAGQGIAFGAGNTFWAKSVGYNLRQVSFDLQSGGGTVLQSFTPGAEIDSNLCGVDVDPANKIFSGISFSDSPNSLKLYQLSDNSNPPALSEQAFFGSKNANSQNNAVSVLKGGKAFGLDVNNGLVALSYGTPDAPAPTITAISYQPGPGPTLTWTTFNGRTYQVQYRASLTSGAWGNIGLPIAGNGPTASYTDSASSGGSGFYRVVAN
jgi:hypothetical protein